MPFRSSSSETWSVQRLETGLLILAITVSGAAALIYEVMWLRSFSLVFGSTTEAAAAVLAAFFAGLTVGGFLGARLARHRATAAFLYAVAEVAIVAGALLVEVWLMAFEHWYRALYQSSLGTGWTMTVIKLLLAFLAMGPPTVAMGVTLPLITRALVARAEHFGRRAGLAYALNTLGATTGVVLAGFVLPAAIGTRGTLYVAACLNLAASALAIGAWRIARGSASRESSVEPGAPGRAAPHAAVLTVAVVSGFGTLALEVIYTRLIVNLTDSSVFSFALMLATFLLCLAAASFLVSLLVDRLRDPWRFLAWTQSFGAVAILISPTLYRMAMGLRSAAGAESLWRYLLNILFVTVLTIGPVVVLLGTALPTVWKIATRHAAESGRRVGVLTGANTLGAIAGSLGAGFILIPVFGLALSIVVVALFYIGLAVLAWTRVSGPRIWPFASLALTGLFVLLFWTGTWRAATLYAPPGLSVVYYKEGESANVAVVESADGIRALMVNNRYQLGSTRPEEIEFQRSQTGLPLELHPDPQSVSFLGIGTGISVGAALEFPVRRVVAMELIPGVVEAAGKFESASRAALRDERVETLIADGRNHLFAIEERFDVIMGDLFVPWHAGTGYLYTIEHFRAVSRRLQPSGIFVQWLPCAQLNAEEPRMISASFLDIFPDTTLWAIHLDHRVPLVGLVGQRGGQPVTASRRVEIESSVAFPGIDYVCDAETLRGWAASAPRNTDGFPRIEFSAAASRFRGSKNLEEVRRTVEDLALRK